MEKYRGDQMQEGNTFVSFLKHTPTATAWEQQISPLCGLGWRMIIYAGPGGSPLQIRFDPSGLAGASLNPFTFEVEVVFKAKDSGKNLKKKILSGSMRLPRGAEGYNVQHSAHSRGYNSYGYHSSYEFSDSSQHVGTVVHPAPGAAYETFIRLKVTISTIKIDHDVHQSVKLKKALGSLLVGEQFTDTKFYLLSRIPGRSAQSTAVRPLFANAELLRGYSAVLDEMLFGAHGFRESDIVDLDDDCGDAISLKLAEYDYPDDSDLEGDEEEGPEMVEVSQEIKEESSLENSSVLPFAFHDFPSSLELTQASPRPAKSTTALKLGPKRYGRILPVNGHAYRTWKSFLLYLITGEINLLPLSSTSKREQVQKDFDARGTIACSPKSMYHLAQKFGVRTLSERALEEIMKNITETNVVEEAFGRFPCL
ncbi:hypothetical protein CC1G_07367 [Coprinopsis cinerea okayama7|uniref:MATH domain-containing protein n=1 Tax=Coprinopsis cinerea (strain Okayama-7 / 130 / ATCC MYA-4618 / FGSC 9003) TaxID=240176 RepID=A8N6J6_COPC7|nr:hypothetical protein CC1G_07367 [Coprinopsis cinerea okayama7\|eukprot:XP_001830452.2 hypothetical protein CC1G_07367 [Coprinopsis cinerea okayama7\